MAIEYATVALQASLFALHARLIEGGAQRVNPRAAFRTALSKIFTPRKKSRDPRVILRA